MGTHFSQPSLFPAARFTSSLKNAKIGMKIRAESGEEEERISGQKMRGLKTDETDRKMYYMAKEILKDSLALLRV